MAQRRMFSKTITNSGKFLKMPATSRLLYYDLGMNADDDGYAEWFTVLRMNGAGQQDLQVLEANGFVQVFDENVLVIMDWKENNYLRSDRYTPSKYAGIYRLDSGIPDVYQLETQVRLGKGSTSALEDSPRVVEVLEESERISKKKPKYPNARTVFSWFPHPEPSWQIDTTQCKHAELLFLRGEAKVRSALAYVEKHKDDEFFYSITSPCDLERKWTKLVNHKPV